MEHGEELWKSDGTAANTVLVKDIRPGPTGSNPAFFAVLGNSLFFAADDGEHGYELWDPKVRRARIVRPSLAAAVLKAEIALSFNTSLDHLFANGWRRKKR
jgi:ELWxxDGT repeat protein